MTVNLPTTDATTPLVFRSRPLRRVLRGIVVISLGAGHLLFGLAFGIFLLSRPLLDNFDYFFGLFCFVIVILGPLIMAQGFGVLLGREYAQLDGTKLTVRTGAGKIKGPIDLSIGSLWFTQRFQSYYYDCPWVIETCPLKQLPVVIPRLYCGDLSLIDIVRKLVNDQRNAKTMTKV